MQMYISEYLTQVFLQKQQTKFLPLVAKTINGSRLVYTKQNK